MTMKTKKASDSQKVAQATLDAVKGELQQAVYGINADVAGAFERIIPNSFLREDINQVLHAFGDQVHRHVPRRVDAFNHTAG